jgi:hypothetical protein
MAWLTYRRQHRRRKRLGHTQREHQERPFTSQFGRAEGIERSAPPRGNGGIAKAITFLPWPALEEHLKVTPQKKSPTASRC